MSEFLCSCDPLYKFIENFLVELLREKVQLTQVIPSSFWTLHHEIHHFNPQTDVKQKIRSDGDTHCYQHRGQDIPLSIVEFLQEGIRCYSTNILRSATNDQVTLLLNWQFFLDLQNLWDELADRRDGAVPRIDFTQDHSKVPSIDADIAVGEIHEAKNRFKSLEVRLSAPSVSKSIIQWITKNYPRDINASLPCRLRVQSVSIGLTESKGPAGKIPLSQYRKFLVAKFVAQGLSKCGCQVDTKKFYSLPVKEEFINGIFLLSQNTHGQKSARRVVTGTVRVRQADQMLPVDMTVEYLHSLRLQGLKSCRFVEGSSGKDDSGMELGWAISAANLSTATVNFDLLSKKPTGSVELTTTNQEEKPSANAGILFIMYNYARVVSLLSRFHNMVKKAEYPALPDILTVEFELLSSKEEVSLIALLFEWPRILDKSVDPCQDELDVSSCLRCMKELADRLNSFYTSIMVLGPPNAPHNFPKMFARLYLLRACRSIIEEFLDLLQVDYNPGASNASDSVVTTTE